MAITFCSHESGTLYRIHCLGHGVQQRHTWYADPPKTARKSLEGRPYCTLVVTAIVELLRLSFLLQPRLHRPQSRRLLLE